MNDSLLTGRNLRQNQNQNQTQEGRPSASTSWGLPLPTANIIFPPENVQTDSQPTLTGTCLAGVRVGGWRVAATGELDGERAAELGGNGNSASS